MNDANGRQIQFIDIILILELTYSLQVSYTVTKASHPRERMHFGRWIAYVKFVLK